MTNGHPVQILKPSVELHSKKGCPLCSEPQNEQGSYSELSMTHVLNLFAAEGKLLKILMDDGGIAWQEPEPFFKEHPEFKGKRE